MGGLYKHIGGPSGSLQEYEVGTEPADYRTAVQRIADNQQYSAHYEQVSRELQEKEEILTRWNTIGQYFLYNGFCFPFAIREEPSAFPTCTGVRLPVHELGIGYTDIPKGLFPFPLNLYRRQDAPEDAPWMEYRFLL